MSVRTLRVCATVYAKVYAKRKVKLFRNAVSLGAALLILLACSTGAWAAGGAISGTVTDQTGAVVPGVDVTATNLDTAMQQTTTTGAEGVYSFLNLPPGRYQVELLLPGFQPFKRTGVTVANDSTLTVDVALAMSEQTTQVVVNSGGVQVETQDTQISNTMSEDKIQSVPLNGRSFTDVLNLQAGVVPVTTTPSNGIIMAGVTSTPPSGDLNPGNISVSGQRETANGFMVNGSDVEEDINMGTSVIPNLDSISELKTLTNNFDAQYGNYSGGQILLTTKSGTNQIHGDVFEFVRNTALDAKSYFELVKPAYDQNQFGGTIGGHIKRDKVYWFVDYQGTRTRQGIDTGIIGVPSTIDRTGNLSDVASSLTGTVSSAGLASMLSTKLGYPVMSGEPYYATGCTSPAACVFPNAIIPTNAWAAPATAMLKYIPTPNFGDGEFESASFDQTVRDDKGGIRVDANTRFGTVFAYYFADDYALNNPYPTGQGGANVPSGAGGTFNALSVGRAQLATFGDTKTWGSSAINEFHFSYMRYANNIGQPTGGVGVPLACQGFVTAIADPINHGACTNTVSQNGIYPLAPSIEGVENVSLQNLGVTIGTDITNAIQQNNTYQWTDSFSKVIGSHTIKFGGEFHYDQVNEVPNATFNGSFQFNGSETGNDFADYLIGAAGAYVQADQGVFNPRNRYFGVFGQDSWRIRPNLTLNYGLRWDILRPWAEKNNQLNSIVPGVQSVVFPGAPEGFLVPGDPGVPNTISPTRYNDIAPRIGIAYAPNFKNSLLQKIFGSSGKTSIRAGYGIFYTAIPGISADIMYTIAPYGYNYVPSGVLFAEPMCTTAGVCRTQPFPTTPPPFGASASNPNSSINWSLLEPIDGDPSFGNNNKTPYAEQYNLTYQRQFKNNWLMTIGYVGSEGHHNLVVVPFNSGIASMCNAAAGCGPSNVDSSRPFSPAFGGDSIQQTIGNSSYNALQTTLRYSGAHDEFTASYTYSVCFDNSSTLGEEVNAIDPAYTRGLCSFDLRDNFFVTYKVDLRIEDIVHWKNRLTQGWSLTGTTRLATGLPVTLFDNSDNSLLGTNPNGVNNNYLDLPNFTQGNLALNSNPAKGNYFNTALFSEETLGQLGNAQRRSFDGPGLVNFDMALLKVVPLTETKSLQFRAEAFNVFNQGQFFAQPDGDPVVNGIFGSQQFGQIVASMPPRLIQLGVKFMF